MKISKGVKVRPQKVVIYGPEGIGKSTFAACFPAPLFIDTEGGTNHLDIARIDPPPVSWANILDTVHDFLRERPVEFATLVLDTADWAERMCIDHVCAKNQKNGIEDFGYGKGYVYLSEEFGKLLNALEDVVGAGYNVVLLAHAKMRKFEQPDEMGAYDRWEMKLSKNVAPMVKEWADLVLFANYKTMVVTKNDGKTAKAQGRGKRVIYTTHHSCWDAKNRHGLPDEIPLDFGQIAHCIPTLATKNAVAQVEPEKEEAKPSAQPEPVQHKAEATTPTIGQEEEIPKELKQLMESSGVTAVDLRDAIKIAGHFTGGEPWEVLDKQGYINGYILPNWDWFVSTINERLPF